LEPEPELELNPDGELLGRGAELVIVGNGAGAGRLGWGALTPMDGDCETGTGPE